MYNSQAMQKRLVGQAVKTSASHAENMGSIPVRVTIENGHQSRCPFSILWWTRMRNLTRRLRQRRFALGSKHCSVLPRGKLVRRSKFPYKIPMGSTPRDFSFHDPFKSALCSHHRYLTIFPHIYPLFQLRVEFLRSSGYCQRDI